MDLLDRLLGHDAWTTRRLLDISGGLTDEQLDRRFDIGHGSVRTTLDHVISNMEVWGDLMSGSAAPSTRSETAADRSIAGMRGRLDRAASRLAAVARPIAARGGWDEVWIDVLDDPPAAKTFGGGIAHVVTHGMHHRAQLLYMLRLLGAEDLPEGDVLSWEQRRGTA